MNLSDICAGVVNKSYKEIQQQEILLLSSILTVRTPISQDKEGILPVATLTECDMIEGSEAEVYIDVYKGDDNFVTSGATRSSARNI